MDSEVESWLSQIHLAEQTGERMDPEVESWLSRIHPNESQQVSLKELKILLHSKREG